MPNQDEELSPIEVTIAELSKELDRKKEELSHKDIWAGIKNVQTLILLQSKDLKTVVKMQDSFVTKDQFAPVKAIAYGAMGIISLVASYWVINGFVHPTASASVDPPVAISKEK